MHTRRFSALTIALTLLASATPASAFTFPDIPSTHRDIKAITFLEARGTMQGKPQADGTVLFDPDAPLNRAELATLLVRAIGLNIGAQEDCFSDVHEGDWFFSHVCSAEKMGLISGYPDGSFKPGQTVNKVEALKMIANALGLQSDVEMYEHFEEGNEWYSPYLTLAHESGWFDTARDAIALDAPLTRADTALLLYRAIVTATDRTMTGGLNPFTEELAAQYANGVGEFYGMQQADLLEALQENGHVYRNERLGFSMMLPKTMPTYMCSYEKPAEIVDVVALENGEDVYIGPSWYETNAFEGTNPDGSGIYGECVRREIEANDDEYYARKITTQKVDSDADIEKFIKKNYGEDCGPFERSPSMQNGIEDISVVNVPRAGVDEPSGLDDFACVTNYLYVLKYNPATKRILSIHLGQDGFFYLPGEDGQFGAALDMTMVRTLRMY